MAYDQIARGADIVHIPDITDSADPVPRRVRVVIECRSGRRAHDALCRAARGQCLVRGMFIYRKEVRLFSDKQVALLQNFAAQAVIAMENARLIDRTARSAGAADSDRRGVAGDQCLARRSGAGIRYDIGKGDAAVRVLVRRSLPPMMANIFTTVATRGDADGLAEALRKRGPLRPSQGVAYDQIVRGRDIVHIPDIDRSGGVPVPVVTQCRSWTERGRRSLSPLRKDDALFGVIMLSTGGRCARSPTSRSHC